MPTDAQPWTLAVTRRCARDDLRISGNWRDHSESNDVIRAFLSRRGQSPVGQERIEVLIPLVQPPCYSLHVGDGRSATWFDEDESVVWLLASAAGHDYDYFAYLA